MKRFLLWIQQSFEFSQREAHGFVLLIFILLLFIVIPHFIQPLFEAKYDSYISDKKLLDSLLLSMKEETLLHKIQPKFPKKPLVLFYFNPNFISKDSLPMLGFTSQSSKSLISYRNKGGYFKIKKDVSKIYGVDTALFSKIKYHILLPDSLPRRNFVKLKNNKTKVANTNTVIDINVADTIAFKTLKGIGSILSKRIVKFREKLGGFISVDQIKEVYGIDSSTYQMIKGRLNISKQYVPDKLRINEVTYEQLSLHPYCNKRTAKQIVNYRKQHNKFSSIEDIKRIKEIDTLKIVKLDPYLEF